MRVFELADELGWTSRRTLDACRAAGLDVPSAADDLTAAQVAQVKVHLRSTAPTVPVPPPPPLVAPRPVAVPAPPLPPPTIPTPAPDPVPGPVVPGLPPVGRPVPPAPEPAAVARIPRRRARRAPEPAGILAVIGLAAVAVGAGVVLVSDREERAADQPVPVDVDAGEATGPVQVAPHRVEVGQCLRFPTRPDPQASSTVEVLELVPCTDPHDLEAYQVVLHPAPVGDPYPGDAAVIEYASSQCLTGFVGFVGVPYGDSELDVRFIRPSAQSWVEQGDRRITCGVFDPAGPSRGTARNAQR